MQSVVMLIAIMAIVVAPFREGSMHYFLFKIQFQFWSKLKNTFEHFSSEKIKKL
jgi:hypothetical protein